MARVTASRPKRSKSDIQKEFSKTIEEQAQEKEATSPKAQELSKLREMETRQAVEQVSVEGVVQKISSLGLEISKSLGELSEKLIQEVERLTSVREAVQLEARELERLHKIDISATALDQLIQDYQAQKEKLAAEMSSQRAGWAEEERERAQEQKEYDDNLRKQRQRETEDYEYKKSLERKKAEDKYEEAIRLLEKKNKEKQETLEKEWQLREASLREKEEDLVRLTKEVEGFPAKLKTEIDRAATEAVKLTEQRFEQQTILLRKDAEAEKRLSELQIKSLQESVTRQSAEIEILRGQFEEAKRQVQDIAVKAIEGASGSKALSHVNQIAMEQAKTRLPQS
ncbi:MAG TPA: hypothetical protein VGQ81_03490 [Acidobacteriota bacterium]|jgi:hypothetical protein|nr:hypothetical protein [Acidobacteriota bacterium]